MAAIVHPDLEQWGHRRGAPAGRPRLVLVPPPRRRPAAVYRRRRLAAVAAAVVLAALLGVVARGAVALLAAGGAAPPAASGPAAPGPTSGGQRVHVVQPGETYWSIARGLAGSGDVRPVVDALIAANGTSMLRSGDRIALPG